MNFQTFCNIFVQLAIFLAKATVVTISALILWILPKRKKCVKGQVVLITGSGHGLGEALAKSFAELHAKVVLWDINEKNATKVAKEITDKGLFAKAYVCDITNENEVIKTAEKVFTDVGDVNILINNAGILHNLPFEDLTSSGIRRTFEVNIISHFWMIRAFLPKMLQKNEGHLVSISSFAGLIGKTNMTDYSASKFAVVGMMQSLLEEIRVKKKRICCTTICPVAISTGMVKFPFSKFSSLIPVLQTDQAAKEIIDAILKEKVIVTIPKSVSLLAFASRCVPLRTMRLAFKFLDYCEIPNPKLPERYEAKENANKL